MATTQKPRAISDIAKEIRSIWSKQGKGVNYAAEPYLDAMDHLTNIDDGYYQDTAEYIVRYFLNNASSFRGEDAKRLKAELRAML